MVSMPLGAVRLTQEFLAHDPPRPIETQRLRKHIAEEILQVSRRVAAAKTSSVMATSGTAAAIAGATHALDSPSGGLKSVPVSRKAVFQLAEDLSKLDVKSRAKLPGIGPRRAEIVIAGVYVFAELMGHCGLSSFRYSSLGLRDGLLAQMLAEHDQATRSRRQTEADRRDSVIAMARHFQVDMKASENLRSLAIQLFRELRRVHGLPAEYESWLAAAAMLNDVGSFINRTGRHRHTYYLVSNSDIFGFTPEQRKVIAAIARYLGRMRPDPSDEPIRSLSDSDEDFVPKAVVLLRLAKALNHGEGRSAKRVTAEVTRERVMLKLVAKRNSELERWMVLKERTLFHEIFGRDLALELA
jgi:exopolyphosphatase/guanosine-5'-triphosphate,3'-diphosphate pyrophosphatase